MWEIEERPRAAQIILIIYKNGFSIGSLTFYPEDREDIEKIKKAINSLNAASSKG